MEVRLPLVLVTKNKGCNMKKLKCTLLTTLAVLFALAAKPTHSYAGSECCNGKLDIGAAYVHVDLLQKGVTYHKLDFGAVKADLNWNVYQGILFKPTILYGKAKNHDYIFNYGAGVGLCIPLNECISFVPSVGITWGYLKASHITFQLKDEDLRLMFYDIQQSFRSVSPYVGLEGIYKLTPCWKLIGCVQYSWSRTHTEFKNIANVKENSQGWNISGLVEYDLSDCWSLNLGGAYNSSLSHEKEGIRAYGIKLGIAFWF